MPMTAEHAHQHYSIVIEWSDEDQAFLVVLPEWADRVFGSGAVAHGTTYDEAVQNGQTALKALIGWAEQNGEPLPQPRVHAGASA
jgi:predicted RNase H-like HicB family nuclease